MDSANLQNKLKLLFEKIAEPGYILNNYYADSLLNKLRSNDTEISNLEKLPFLSELVLGALKDVNNVHLSVKVFTIRLLAIVSQNELHFTKIFAKQGGEIYTAFNDIIEPATLPSTRVAYLEVALALTKHNSGTSWLIESQAWQQIFKLCFGSQTVFVLRQAYKFIADFLWRLSDNDEEENLITVLDFILEPIMKNPYYTLKSLSREEEMELTKQFEPVLQMLMTILNNTTKVQQTNLLIKLLVTNYSTNSRLFSILSLTHREDIMHLLAKLIFSIVFAKIFLTKPMQEGNFLKQDFMELTVSYFNTVQFFVKRRFVVPLMDYCNTCCIIWSESWAKSQGPTFEKNGKTFELQSQLLFILLVPVLVYIKSKKGYCRLDQDNPLNQYILKLLNSSCEHTNRAAYSVRNLMYESDPLAMSLHCVKRLSCLKNHLNNAGANLIFQALFYVLNNYVPIDGNGDIVEDEDLEESLEKMLVMTYVMDTVYMLVKNHDINWHESLETVCLYNQIHNILKRKNLSCKFVVAALNLITVTVKKFLPPSLSLLLESRPGSAIHDLGKLIYSKMHDPNWEIRDSALELLLVCTEISFIKYTPFQTQIIENNLILVAATIGLNDSEFYVQASALKCLGAASKIPAIWEQLTQHFPNIQQKLLIQLCHNPEGIVRKEVVAIICEIYQNLKLQPSYKSTLYKHMISISMSDFHWEVQIAALKFWRVVIQSLLSDQGMLDGTFPPVTFSKETRKIVTLNEVEIQKRLSKILEELASIGCLTVLVKLLDDDIDAEIMECSLNISLELYNILQKYKINNNSRVNTESNKFLTNNIQDIKQEGLDSENLNDHMDKQSESKSESVIEGILKSNDMNLLSKIYEQQMKLQNEGSDEDLCKPKIILQKYASPMLFLQHLTRRDYRSLIEEKRRWKEGIRNTSSLLDDILGIYESSEEVNDMDCY